MSRAAQEVQRLVEEMRKANEKDEQRRRTRGTRMTDEAVQTEPKEAKVAGEKVAKRVRAKKADGIAKATKRTKIDKASAVFLNIRTTKAIKNAYVSLAKKDKSTLNAVVGAALEAGLA
jgi:hypothetical protein